MELVIDNRIRDLSAQLPIAALVAKISRASSASSRLLHQQQQLYLNPLSVTHQHHHHVWT